MKSTAPRSPHTPASSDVAAVLARRNALLEAVLDTMTVEERERTAAVAARFVQLAEDAAAAGANSVDAP